MGSLAWKTLETPDLIYENVENVDQFPRSHLQMSWFVSSQWKKQVNIHIFMIYMGPGGEVKAF